MDATYTILTKGSGFFECARTPACPARASTGHHSGLPASVGVSHLQELGDKRTFFPCARPNPWCKANQDQSYTCLSD
ncbi:hypothetical protein HYQ44_019369 [Verticillium longisporum]|nr:hypothetical protein HYQ44_019369 [Verticillium longisporum]